MLGKFKNFVLCVAWYSFAVFFTGSDGIWKKILQRSKRNKEPKGT